MKRASRALAGLMLVALPTLALVSPQASAGTNGKWTLIGKNSANFAQSGLQRTSDGTLHIVWTRLNATDSGHYDLVHTPVGSGGDVGTTTAIETNWDFIWSVVDLAAEGQDGIRAFWSGSLSPESGLWSSTSDIAGTTWSPEAKVDGPSGAPGVALSNGVSYQSYQAGGYGVVVHRGLDPAGPRSSDYGDARIGACCSTDPDLATDTSTGQMWIAWYSSASDPQSTTECRCGIYVSQVNLADGEPLTPPIRLEGSAARYNGVQSSSALGVRTPIVARPGGGLYVAYTAGYPFTNKVLLWHIGPSGPDSPIVVAKGGEGETLSDVALSSAPDGRVWVAWSQDGKIKAAISDANVTSFAPPITFAYPGDPSGFQVLYNLAANAQGDRLDLIGNFSTGNGTAFWHTQVSEPPAWTSGADTITGTATNNLLYGGDGNDVLKGLGGADKLYGGEGGDKLNGGPGKDLLNGGKGTDTCIITPGDTTKSCEKEIRNR